MSDYFKVFTASDGTEIQYVDIGSGKPLLYVHGFGGSSEVQIPIFNALKDKFRCICFDQRGYGKTEGREKAGIVQSAKDAKEFIEYLNLDSVVYLGYSMGAIIMFAYINMFGCQYLERAIIGDSSPKLISDDTWDCGLYQGWYTAEQAQKDLLTMQNDYDSFNLYFTDQAITKHTKDDPRDFITAPDLREVIKKKAGAAVATVEALLSVSPEQQKSNILYWKSICELDFRDTLPKITVPTAIFYADPGSIYDPRVAHYMAEHIPDAKLYCYKDCTHMAKNEKVDQFISNIIKFSEV